MSLALAPSVNTGALSLPAALAALTMVSVPMSTELRRPAHLRPFARGDEPPVSAWLHVALTADRFTGQPVAPRLSASRNERAATALGVFLAVVTVALAIIGVGMIR